MNKDSQKDDLVKLIRIFLQEKDNQGYNVRVSG